MKIIISFSIITTILFGRYFYLKNDIEKYISDTFSQCKQMLEISYNNYNYNVIAIWYKNDHEYELANITGAGLDGAWNMYYYDEKVKVPSELASELIEKAAKFWRNYYSDYQQKRDLEYIAKYKNAYFSLKEYPKRNPNFENSLTGSNYKIGQWTTYSTIKREANWIRIFQEWVVIYTITTVVFIILKFAPHYK